MYTENLFISLTIIITAVHSNVHDNTIKRIAESYSLNPSFRKPTYMRYISSKKHSPGSDVILPCMTTGVKPITYTWLFNGKSLTQRKRLKFSDDRSMLKIKRIRDVDIGIYKCIATNAYGGLYFNFNMKVKEKQKKPSFYDQVMMSRKRLAIRPTKHSIRFECQADSQALIHYIWLKNGKPFKHIKPRNRVMNTIDDVREVNQSGDLLVKNLKVNDGGLYTCVAFNKFGNISFTYELRILRKLSGGPPKVIPYTRPQKIHVKTGENVTFDCLEIISGTIPDVRWFHLYNKENTGLLPDIPKDINWDDINNPKYKFISKYIPAGQYTTFKIKSTHTKAKNNYVYDDTDPSGLRLNLINVTTKDTGAYTCFVSNLEGNDYAIFHLTVEEQSNE